MLLENKEILITLYDTPAAKALYDMLPLELTFEDYNNIEKISYLPEEISTEGEPDGVIRMWEIFPLRLRQ